MKHYKKVPRIQNRFLIFFLFLLPLVSIPAYDGFDLPKQFFLVFCVTALFLVQSPGTQFKRNLPFSPLSILAVAVFFFSLLSIFQAVNRVDSLIRLFFLLTVILFYLIIVAQDESASHWEMMIKAIVFSAGVVSLIGIYQFWFGHVPGLRSLTGPSATFSNKNMAAHFVGIVFPFSLYLFRRFQNMFYGLMASTLGIYIFYCQTMAVFLAGMVSVIVSLALILLKKKTARKRTGSFQIPLEWRRGTAIKVFICLMVVIGLVILPLLIRSSGIQKINTPVRIGKAIQGEEAGVKHRLDLWGNTLDMIWDHPWLGVGIGNWKYQYPLYHRSSRLDKHFGIGIQPIETNSEWLQVLSETGIFGALAFFLLVIAGLGMASRAYAREKDNDRGGMILALFWGFLTLTVIVSFGSIFRHPVHSLLFWLILAGIHRYYHSNKQQMVIPSKGSLRIMWSVFFVLKVCLVLFVLFMFQAVRSDLVFYNGVTLWNDGRHNQGVNLMSQAASIYPMSHAYHSVLSRAYLRINLPENAREYATRALRIHPNDINSLNNLGVALNMAGLPDKALIPLERGVKIKPDGAILRFNLGLTLWNVGRYSEAANQFREVLKIDPRYPQARKFLNDVLEKDVGISEDQLER